MASDSQQTLVLFTDEGVATLISYWRRSQAEQEIEELEALKDGGHTLAHVSAEIIWPTERDGPLVDEFEEGRQLANRLETLGYYRQSGVWLYPGYEGIPMTLPEAIKHAIAAGRWKE